MRPPSYCCASVPRGKDVAAFLSTTCARRSPIAQRFGRRQPDFARTVALQWTISFPKTAAMPATAEQAYATSPPRRARRRAGGRVRAARPVRDRLEYLALRAAVGALAALPLAAAV